MLNHRNLNTCCLICFWLFDKELEKKKDLNVENLFLSVLSSFHEIYYFFIIFLEKFCNFSLTSENFKKFYFHFKALEIKKLCKFRHKKSGVFQIIVKFPDFF